MNRIQLMLRRRPYVLSLLVALLLYASAVAVPTATLVEVPFSPAALAADPALANFRTLDLRVNVEPGHEWLRTGLDVRLTAGTFYNPPMGNSLPVPHLWPLFPNLRHDTFITQAANPLIDSAFAPPMINSAWPELPIRPPVFTDTHFSAHYGITPGVHSGSGLLTVARLTVSLDAQGALFGENQDTTGAGVPVPFQMIIPEPSGATALVAATALLIRRRRRWHR